MSDKNKPEVSSSLDSSILSEARYDPFMEVMTIQFKNDSVYEYIEVPKETYEELVSAPSAGKYFHLNVRGKFEFLRRK